MHSEFIADTSVWISHFKRRGNPVFARALQDNRVLLHSLVYAELVLGGMGLRGRSRKRYTMKQLFCFRRWPISLHRRKIATDSRQNGAP